MHFFQATQYPVTSNLAIDIGPIIAIHIIIDFQFIIGDRKSARFFKHPFVFRPLS
jgi:hypothetical protein